MSHTESFFSCHLQHTKTYEYFHMLPVLSILISVSLIVMGCRTESKMHVNSTFSNYVEIKEDSDFAVISANEMTQISDRIAVISQYPNGPLLIVNVWNGNLLESMSAPDSIVDLAFTGSASFNSVGTSRRLAFDSTIKAEMYPNISYKGLGFLSPKYVSVVDRDEQSISVLTHYSAPVIRLGTTELGWTTSAGIATVSKHNYSLLSFTPLEVFHNRYPQRFAFAPAFRKNWNWVTTYDPDNMENSSVATLPLMNLFDSAGKQVGNCIDLPEEAKKRQEYRTLTNGLVMLEPDCGVMVDRRFGNVIVLKFKDRKSFNYSPLEHWSRPLGLDSTLFVYSNVCRIDSSRFEIVISPNVGVSDSLYQCFIATVRIDSRRSDPTLTFESLAEVEKGIKVGPGCVMQSKSGSAKSLVRMIYRNDKWYFATRSY